MKFELIILAVTAFFIFNIYHDGKYTKLIMSYKKYFKMLFFAVVGIAIYLLVKRNPKQSQQLLLNANNVIKYMPIDKTSMDMISPILDFTSNNRGSFMGQFNESFQGDGSDDDIAQNELKDGTNTGWSGFSRPINDRQERRILSSGGKGTKRCVSETKKKYVASNQNWMCGDCGNQLNAWFEVDHKKRLEHGGGNDVANLVALCRECHGKKTAMENL